MDQTDRRRRSYNSGGRISRERMAREAPLDSEALARVEASDVVVVRGIYDHVGAVLKALEVPFTKVTPPQLGQVNLNPGQLLVVNCPGQMARRDVGRIAEFVAAGGSLFTTDWALRHVIEPGFPGVLAYNDRPTQDDVVRIEIGEHDNPFLAGVMDTGDDPQWWLEGSSFPIRILDPDRAQVLISSRELEAKYGEAPVAVLFQHGRGEVFHMISHYYLQRTELRSARHRAPASAYATEKGVTVDAATAQEMADLSLGEVESAGSSARLMANWVARGKRRSEERSDS